MRKQPGKKVKFVYVHLPNVLLGKINAILNLDGSM